ncbi:glycosyltransferase family protein [Spirillospora sp. CA-294931]|uniref:glycosyltransferase family protein n=1 Tax=Spirillospora sp. CA-294931 TaxID=3240042 RepID=UPI003D906BDE
MIDDASAQRARGDRLAADNATVRLRLAAAETERAERDRQIERLTRLLYEATDRIGDLDRERAEQAHRAAVARWEAEVQRHRRWTRLGGAVAALRHRPLAPASYRKLRAALRAALVPPEPAEPRAPRRPEIRVADTELLDVAALHWPDGPIVRPDVTAAVVVSPAMERLLHFEWRQLTGLTPADWREAFESERPDLLFVESGPTDLPLDELLAWCREHGVPTVLWHTGTPLPTEPTPFDHTFTTEDHEGSHPLPFAAQPRVHNPIRTTGQGRYPLLYEGEYDEAAEPLIAPAPRLGGHFYGTGFPWTYRQRVVDPLPDEKSLTARKRYRIFLTPDTRRAYEAAAAGIPIIHTADRRRPGPEFGPVVHDGKDATRALRALLNGPELRDRQAHLALREIHESHTYGHRVETVLDAAGLGRERPRPTVSMVLPTCRAGQITQAIEQVARQRWRPLQLVLVLHGLDLDLTLVEKRAREAGLDDVIVIAAHRDLTLGGCLNLGIRAADGAYIGKMDDDELYGPHYVSDLIPAFSYTEAGVVGKLAHYAYLESIGATLLRYPDHEHRYVNVVRGGALLAEGDLLRTYRFADIGRGEDTDLFRRLADDGVRVYAADRYSFITIRHADPNRHTWQPTDRELMSEARLASYGLPKEHILF